MTKQQLLDAELLTNADSDLVEPVTVGGWYKAFNGYYYLCTWHAGRLTKHRTGHSVAYREAIQDFERTAGAVIDEGSGRRFDDFLAHRFFAA